MGGGRVGAPRGCGESSAPLASPRRHSTACTGKLGWQGWFVFFSISTQRRLSDAFLMDGVALRVFAAQNASELSVRTGCTQLGSWGSGSAGLFSGSGLVTAGACGGLTGDGVIAGPRAAEPRAPLVLEASWWRSRASPSKS